MAQTMSKNMHGNPTALWASARERLRRELGDPVFDAWIGALQLLSMEKGEVKIGAPKPFVRNWVAIIIRLGSSGHSARKEPIRGPSPSFLLLPWQNELCLPATLSCPIPGRR